MMYSERGGHSEERTQRRLRTFDDGTVGLSHFSDVGGQRSPIVTVAILDRVSIVPLNLLVVEELIILMRHRWIERRPMGCF